jgi:hypothetical protein
VRIFYDTEFLERGPMAPVILLSIGMVREDGAELYLVNGGANGAAWDAAYADPWLRDNVLAHLPRDERHTEEWRPDYNHPSVALRSEIASRVSVFCAEGLGKGEQAELWAYYADYDHVVLSQLFGRMIDLPRHMPMYTRDLMQHLEEHGLDKSQLPKQEAGHHNALYDARWVRDAWNHVNG